MTENVDQLPVNSASSADQTGEIPLPEDEAYSRLEQETVPEAMETSLAGSLKKTLILALILAVLLLLCYLSPFRHLFDSFREQLPNYIRDLGIWAVPAFTLGMAVLVTVGVPRLALCTVGGMVFGFWGGMIWGQVGTLLAYYVVFLFVRLGGYRSHIQALPQLARFSGLLRRGGVPAVILARQIPLHGLLINVMLGLSRIRHRDYLLGTLIGILPEAIPFTLVGTSLTQQSDWSKAGYLAGAVILVALVWLLLAWHLRRRRLNAKRH